MMDSNYTDSNVNNNHVETTNDRTKMSTRLLGNVNSAESKLLENMPSLMEHNHPKILIRVSFLLLLLNVALFAVWILTTPYGFPWFIWPIYVSAMALGIFLIVGSTAYANKPWSIHSLFFFATSFALIISNEHGGVFPWSIYPIGLFAIAFGIHTLFVSFPTMANHWFIHLIICCIVNIVLFVTYCYTNVWFPWFLVIAFVWFALVAVHFIVWKVIEKRRGQQFAANLSSMPSTQAPEVYTAQPNYGNPYEHDPSGVTLDFAQEDQAHVPVYPPPVFEAPVAQRSSGGYQEV